MAALRALCRHLAPYIPAARGNEIAGASLNRCFAALAQPAAMSDNIAVCHPAAPHNRADGPCLLQIASYRCALYRRCSPQPRFPAAIEAPQVVDSRGWSVMTPQPIWRLPRLAAQGEAADQRVIPGLLQQGVDRRDQSGEDALSPCTCTDVFPCAPHPGSAMRPSAGLPRH